MKLTGEVRQPLTNTENRLAQATLREKMSPEVLAIEREVDQLKVDGKIPEAIEKMKEALAIDDSFARGHLTLAVLYGKVDEHLKSVEHAERVIELEPNDKFNFVALSETYRRAFEGTRDESFIQKAEEAKARAAMTGGCGGSC